MILLSCKIRILLKALNHTYKTYTIISTNISSQYKHFKTVLMHVVGELLIVFYTNIVYDYSYKDHTVMKLKQ